MARRRGLEDSGPGLDLIPVLSLVVHLVPMLLLSVRFMTVVQLVARGPVVPALDAPNAGALRDQSQRVVSVEVDDQGFRVGGAEGLDPRIPCRGACGPDTYDFEALAGALRTLKQAHPDERRVVVAPTDAVPFDVVARVMATAQADGAQELFPEPLLAVRR